MESNEFLNESYRFLQIDYPKFFKMDVLSKVASLATELICKSLILKEIDKEEVGIVLGNKSSSLVADLTHQRSIQDKKRPLPKSRCVCIYFAPIL